MAMTRFDPREKFADRLWTREQVLTKVAPLPDWLDGPCSLRLNGSWLMICDDVKKACWNEPLPELGDYDGLIRAFNAMPIEPGCESPFGRSWNVNHKRQGYDDRQWPHDGDLWHGSVVRKHCFAKDALTGEEVLADAVYVWEKRSPWCLFLYDRFTKEANHLHARRFGSGVHERLVAVHGQYELDGQPRYDDRQWTDQERRDAQWTANMIAAMRGEGVVPYEPAAIPDIQLNIEALKAPDEHVDLGQYLDMPTEPPEDSWNRLQREYAHKIPACFTRDVDLSIFAPAARHQLESILANGARVCLEEFDFGNQLKVGWAWIAGSDGDVRRMTAFLHPYSDGWDVKREPEMADKLVWPFPPYEPKQAGEDWEIWSKRRNGFIRVGRDAPRKEGANPVHAPPDDLKYWPKCAKCDKPADFYEMESQDMGALYKIRVHHHGKVHVIEKGAMEIACLRGPLEAFTDGWDK